jgi:hypothetical protein
MRSALAAADFARCREITAFCLSDRFSFGDTSRQIRLKGPDHETLAPRRADLDGQRCRQRGLKPACGAAGDMRPRL